ncbi:CHAD domain-containing protein, partial [Micromonospora sp. WMMD736]|uniref:CYTH and CHAD domain-containing protein n=1 Tax=Micromonospora sp. WMMD736 TaxID=3404112 RepID=UPI003B9602B0
MTTSTRAFKTKGAVSADDITAALQPKFAVSFGTERTNSRTWLDTFDWRLYSAGVPLEFIDDGPLTAHLPNGAVLNCPQPAKDWPVLVDDLPPGRLRETLDEVVAPRALLPVVTTRRTVSENRVLNDDDKTVARLIIERNGDDVSWIQVHPLRGYDSDADRIAARLSDVARFTEIAISPYDEALTHAERRPAEDSGPRLTAATPAPKAVAAVLGRYAAVIEDNVACTIEAIDIEFLHDLRVAVRRTRSVLKLVGDVLPDDLAARFAPEFKWLGDLTTPVRDLDVYLLDFGGMAGGLTSAAPSDLEPFRSFLQRHRTAERRRLVRGLRSRRFER